MKPMGTETKTILDALQQGFSSLNRRADVMDGRFDAMDGRLDRMDRRSTTCMR